MKLHLRSAIVLPLSPFIRFSVNSISVFLGFPFASALSMSSEAPTNSEYVPPKVWNANPDLGGTWGSINRPTAGARFTKELAVGSKPLQLYSTATPNGKKVTMLLEELLEAGAPAEYDAWKINIFEGDQFSSGFVDVNPNSKIPAMVDHSVDPPLKIFESGNIMLYLAEKYDMFLPKDLAKKTECLNWLFWQIGSGPYLGGGFGHFFTYAPIKIEYAIDRFTMETKRQLDVLDKHLADKKYFVGDDYTIADMAIWSWYGHLMMGTSYPGSAEFLQIETYTNLMRWTKEMHSREAIRRGLTKEYKLMWEEEEKKGTAEESEPEAKKQKV